MLRCKAIRVHMNSTWSIYPGANGGGAGDLVNGLDNALSKGLGDLGRGGGNPLGMLAMLGGLASGALSGLNRFGNRFKLYRDFKENWVKKPYNDIKTRAKNFLGMSDDVAKGATNSIDDAIKGGASAASRGGAGSMLLDQYGKPMGVTGTLDDAARAAGGTLDDAARGAAGAADDVARAGASTLGKVGARAIPLVGVAIDGTFRYSDYKNTEERYDKALASHKAGGLSDAALADAEHARGSSHSRNASGMAGGLIGATLTAAAVGGGVGFAFGGVGAIPGFLIGAGAGVVGYLAGDKIASSASDALWGNPPSYGKSAETLNRNNAETGLSNRNQEHDAGQAWAAARQNSTYAQSGDIRTPGIVSNPSEVAKFSQNLSGAAVGSTAVEKAQSNTRAKALAKGKSYSADPRQAVRHTTIG